MQRNIKIIFEYDGTNYCGWQTQRIRQKKNKRYKHSIQETIESCLKKILKEKINLIASGRTDSGVHALAQVANFKTQSDKSPKEIKAALNGNLPKDIRIIKAGYVPLEFHSRYSAKSKVYRYLILNEDYCSVFLRGYAYWLRFPLDYTLMRKAAKFLKGRHDFKAFSSSGSSAVNTKRTIKQINIQQIKILSSNLICIEVEADGFLYNMVRNIVGTLTEVARRRFIPEYLKEILETKNRALAGPCVPAKGLYLVKVKY